MSKITDLEKRVAELEARCEQSQRDALMWRAQASSWREQAHITEEALVNARAQEMAKAHSTDNEVIGEPDAPS